MTIAITEQIKVLVDLQKVDSEIYKIKRELSTHPGEEKKILAGFDSAQSALKAAEADSKNAQVRQKEKEVDLQAKEEKIKKLQSQLYQLKSNKEYQAMEMEIRGTKADNSLLEEEILRLFDAVEEAKGRVTKEKEMLAAEEKKMKEKIGYLKQRGTELSASLTELEEKRKTFLSNIEPRLLSQYERILKSREGLAIVPVKNNSCGGCHIDLPPQVVNELRMQDKLIVCEECARILYWMPS